MIPLQLTLKLYHSNRVRLDMVKLPIPTNLTRWINEAIAKRLDVEHPETIGAVEVLPPEPEKPINPMELWEKAKQAPKPLDFIGPYRIKYGQDPAFLALAEGQRRELKKKSIILGLEDLLEIVAKKNSMELSEDEKACIMAEYNQKQMEVAAKQLEERRRAARPLDYIGSYTLPYGKNEDYAMLAKYCMDSARRKKREFGLEDALEQVALVGNGELGEAEKVELAKPAAAPVKQLESVPPIAQDSEFWGEDDFSKGTL